MNVGVRACRRACIRAFVCACVRERARASFCVRGVGGVCVRA